MNRPESADSFVRPFKFVFPTRLNFVVDVGSISPFMKMTLPSFKSIQTTLSSPRIEHPMTKTSVPVASILTGGIVVKATVSYVGSPSKRKKFN